MNRKKERKQNGRSKRREREQKMGKVSVARSTRFTCSQWPICLASSYWQTGECDSMSLPKNLPWRRQGDTEKKKGRKKTGKKKTGNSFYASTVPFSITIFPPWGFASLPSSLLSLFLLALSFSFSFGELVVLWVFTLVWWFNMWCNINPSFSMFVYPMHCSGRCQMRSGERGWQQCKM